jgi:hypothetical protein
MSVAGVLISSHDRLIPWTVWKSALLNAWSADIKPSASWQNRHFGAAGRFGLYERRSACSSRQKAKISYGCSRGLFGDTLCYDIPHLMGAFCALL